MKIRIFLLGIGLLVPYLALTPASATQSEFHSEEYIAGGGLGVCRGTAWPGVEKPINVAGGCFVLPAWTTRAEIHIVDQSGLRIPGFFRASPPPDGIGSVGTPFCNDAVRQFEGPGLRYLHVYVGTAGSENGGCNPVGLATKGVIEVTAFD